MAKALSARNIQIMQLIKDTGFYNNPQDMSVSKRENTFSGPKEFHEKITYSDAYWELASGGSFSSCDEEDKLELSIESN